ncbi:hypothetical protein U1872_18200 [Sphingomonas sp. RB3P16]|uniref:hypothetical protein n=1 Tax=Parasphingomonas frigoris TaxID=3096163 RepID=UPI002FCBF1F2
MAGPWDKYRTQAANPPGGVVIGRPNPYAAQMERERLDKLRADNAVTPYDKRTAAANASKAEADARNAPAIQAADARIKNAQADAIERANAEAAADAAASTMKPTGKMWIEDVPPAARPIVRAMLAGNLPVGARSVTSPKMLPYLQMAINVDPNFSAAVFPARAAAVKQLADMKSTGGYLTSLAANIDHSREEEAAIERLGNPGGLYGRWGGAAAHNYFVNKGGPAGAAFDQANRVYSGEQVKSIVGNVGSAGGGSALADRQDAERAISADMPIDAQRAALRVGAIQNYQKYRDADQGFMRTMGTHIPNALSQEQAAQLLHMMRLQENGSEGPIPKDVDPAFIALATGGKPGSNDPSHPWRGSGNDTPPPAAGEMVATTAHYINQSDPKVAQQIDGMIRAGKSAAEINSVLQPLGYPGVDQRSVSLAQEHHRNNPTYKGSYGDAMQYVEQGANTRAGNEIGLSTLGSAGIGAYDGLNSLTFGKLGNAADYLSGKPGQSELAAHAAGQAHPFAKGVGELVGTLPAFLGAEAGLAGLAARGVGGSRVAALLAKPVTADLVGGAYAGAGSSPDNRVAGALFGAVLGAGGGTIGRNVVSPVAAALARTRAGKAVTGAVNEVGNAGRRALNLPEVAPKVAPPKPSVAEALIMKKAGNAGVDGIAAQLAEAQRLGVPMALADTHPALTSLTGAAVRRSPDAAATAEGALLPRARGQIDRLGSAVERDLGPIGNIPQISADMTEQARTAAGPLYDAAYADPVPGTPELAGTLNTPFGRDALNRARTIAANERRAPSELGFAQDAEGNTLLNPQPNQQIADHLAARAELDDAQNAYRMARNGAGDMVQAQQRIVMARDALRRTEGALAGAPDPATAASVPNYTTQTLDYVKRGMDDVLEDKRSQLTGRLVLDEAGRAQNQVRQQFLSEVDRHNPAYADARNAYAGPVHARDAMARGQDAYSLHPDELAMQVGNQSPEHLAQMQLGYRDALMTRANAARFNANPFDATLGTPAAEQRLGALYPDNAGNADLLRQRDLEAQLARSHAKILGNSETAARTIADQEFANPMVESAMHAGAAMATHGASIPVTAARVAGAGLRDRIAMGVGEGAARKANSIAELLLNPDPAASAATLSDLANASKLYQEYVRASGTRLGAPIGAAGAGWIASGGSPN